MATEAACQILDSDGSLLEDNLQAALSGTLPSYCVVSVFGAQGSGKSTLLNTMSIRQSDLNLLVLDIEGTGGTERATAPDLERQLGVLALTAADIVIVNINNVLVENAATMTLLHVILQEKIRLQLQLLDTTQSRRTVLCIVIRDIDPDQQDDNAQARAFKHHLETTWKQLIKPPGLQASNIDNYFQTLQDLQIEVAGLQDKRYREKEFGLGAKCLAQELIQTGKTMSTPVRSEMAPDLYWRFVKELWSQISSAQGLKLQNVLATIAEAACAQAAADAFAKFETNPDWLVVHTACQQHLLLLEELVRLVVRAVRESLEGYEAITVWCNRSAAAKHKQELSGNLYQAIYTAVTMPQVQKMEVFRLAYLCEHIWPLDSDSPTCAETSSSSQAFGGAAVLETYKTGDVDFIDVEDDMMIQSEIRRACERYREYIFAVHELAHKTLLNTEQDRLVEQLRNQMQTQVQASKLRRVAAAGAAEVRAQGERAAAAARTAQAEASRARAAEAARDQAEARAQAAEDAQARAEATGLQAEDTTPDVCSRVLEAVFDSNLIPIMTRMCIDGKLLSSSSSGREWLTGPRGGEYYLTEWGTKVYRNHK